MNKRQTIELDCPPGHPRPGDIIESILLDTGLPTREPVSSFFGNWTWDYNDIDPEKWGAVNNILEIRIKDLYYKGVIRYGSW